MESCAGCARLPTLPSLAKGCSLQFTLQSSSCPGYAVHASPLFWRLFHGHTLGSSIPGLLPIVSFSHCVCTLCQTVAGQEMDPGGTSAGVYRPAKLLGCSCAMCPVPGSTCILLQEWVLLWSLSWSLPLRLGWGVPP